MLKLEIIERERAEERDVRGTRRGSHKKKEGSQKLPKHSHWESVKWRGYNSFAGNLNRFGAKLYY